MRIKPVHIILVLSLYVAFVFVQSLFFKYTNSIETQHIFGTLDAWAATLGLGGIFAQTGLFSQHVIGTAELAASSLLLAGLAFGRRALTALGAALGLAIMSGAISFHLFTPLGVEIQGDGGLLFAMACGVWLSCAAMIFMTRDALLAFVAATAEGLLRRSEAA